jgi:hypothetical protein
MDGTLLPQLIKITLIDFTTQSLYYTIKILEPVLGSGSANLLLIWMMIPCTFNVPNRIVLIRSLCRRRLNLSEVFPMGFLASFFFVQ